MKSIAFKNVEINPGLVEFDVEYEGIFDHIYFKLPDAALPYPSEVAVAMSTFVGSSADCIMIQLPIDRLVKRRIEQWTGAILACDAAESYPKTSTNGSIVLNFSGGFDSLAAMFLLPQDTQLVSVNYLGPYQRECDFFKRFSPHLVTTNFRSLGYNLYSDAFMGAGMCLLKSHLNSACNVQGNVFEADQFVLENDDHTTEAYDALGWSTSTCVRGMTQVATAMVVSYYAPHLLGDSLRSLAGVGTEKHCRKNSIMRAISIGRAGYLHESVVSYPDSKVKFGTAFASDLISMYELKLLGWDEALIRVQEIPDSAVKLTRDLRFDFVTRLDTKCLIGLRNATDVEYFLDRAARAGVVPYERNDYEERDAVVEYLMRFRDGYESKRAQKVENQRRRAAEHRRSLSKVEEVGQAKPIGPRTSVIDKRIDVRPKDSRFNYKRIMDGIPSGFYQVSLNMVSVSACEFITLSIIDKEANKRLLTKTYSADESINMCISVKYGENMQLIVYPNVPGKTSGCGVSASIRVDQWSGVR